MVSLLADCNEIDLRNELARLNIDNGGNFEMVLMRLRLAVGQGRFLLDVRSDPVDKVEEDGGMFIPILSVVQISSLKVGQLRVALMLRNITFHSKQNKADLVALLNGTEAVRRASMGEGDMEPDGDNDDVQGAEERIRIAAALALELQEQREEHARLAAMERLRRASNVGVNLASKFSNAFVRVYDPSFGARLLTETSGTGSPFCVLNDAGIGKFIEQLPFDRVKQSRNGAGILAGFELGVVSI